MPWAPAGACAVVSARTDRVAHWMPELAALTAATKDHAWKQSLLNVDAMLQDAQAGSAEWWPWAKRATAAFKRAEAPEVLPAIWAEEWKEGLNSLRSALARKSLDKGDAACLQELYDRAIQLQPRELLQLEPKSGPARPQPEPEPEPQLVEPRAEIVGSRHGDQAMVALRAADAAYKAQQYEQATALYERAGHVLQMRYPCVVLPEKRPADVTLLASKVKGHFPAAPEFVRCFCNLADCLFQLRRVSKQTIRQMGVISTD